MRCFCEVRVGVTVRGARLANVGVVGWWATMLWLKFWGWFFPMGNEVDVEERFARTFRGHCLGWRGEVKEVCPVRLQSDT